MYIPLGWLWWVIVQLIMGLATVVGWMLLIPFCSLQFWEHDLVPGIGDKERKIDVWRWVWLNRIYGNPEDGVSGRYARVWDKNGTVLGPYMPNAWAPWRAYCWSAWRNSCDNLKYVFAWQNGPRALLLGHKIGWWPENGLNVPVW